MRLGARVLDLDTMWLHIVSGRRRRVRPVLADDHVSVCALDGQVDSGETGVKPLVMTQNLH